MTKSNRQIGRENLERLKTWLASTDGIPERRGKANISAIAVATRVDRQVLYGDHAQAMIKEAVEAKGLGMPEQVRTTSDEVPVWAQRRIQQLEQKLANSVAEVGGLRDRLKAYKHIEDQMLRTGMLPR